MKKSMINRDKIIFILEIISVIFGILIIPFSVNKIMHGVGFGLFFAGGLGLISRLINKLSKNKK